MSSSPQQKEQTPRPPIIAVMGHIDHGKSTLLDYIRKSNVVESESGGITQHISAYEAHHKTDKGDRKITFLDTPGHEAFAAMRARGATVADIAILIVSAEDGVKAQTLEAYKSIKESGIPYVVAINKIDKPNAQPDKIKNELVENEIYLEGYGGDIPYVAISAKTGEGIPELLDMLILVSEMEELTGDATLSAEGVVIESNVDPKMGISATLLITNGKIERGMFVASGDVYAPVRRIENFAGKQIDSAQFSSPIRITGFTDIPAVGAPFYTFETKKEAEKYIAEQNEQGAQTQNVIGDPEASVVIPLILKTDVLGTIDAVEHELKKITVENVALKIIHSGVGDISENDIKIAASTPDAFVVGFRVGVDAKARSVAEQAQITPHTFGIIYNITDFMEEEMRKRKPKETVEEPTGEAKVIRKFSATKEKQVIGGRVQTGAIRAHAEVKIMRRDTEIGRGTVIELQQQKAKASEVSEGQEFGMQVQSRTDIEEGDMLIPFERIEK